MNMMNKKNLLKMMALGMAAAAVFGLAGCGDGKPRDRASCGAARRSSVFCLSGGDGMHL